MAERAGTAVYQAVAVVVPVLAALAPRSTVPVLVASAVMFAVLVGIWRLRPTVPSITTWAGLVLLVLWAAFSNFWSIEPAWRATAMLAGSIACGLVFLSFAAYGDRDTIGRWLVIGLVIGLLIYCFEGISGAWLTRAVHGFTWRDLIEHLAGGISIHAYLINGTAILSLLVWPAVLFLMRHGQRLLGLALVIAVMTVVASFGSDAGLIALVLGALGWEIAARFGRRAIQGVAVLFAILVLALPLAAHRLPAEIDLERLMIENRQIPTSAFVRLFIWKFTAERIAERPILGWGFDASRRIPGGGDAIVMRTPVGQGLINEIKLPLHPHNQILQIWLELGAVGALIVALAGAVIIWRMGSQGPPARNAGFALLISTIVYDVASFGAWQSWWLAAVFLSVGLYTAVRGAEFAR